MACRWANTRFVPFRYWYYVARVRALCLPLLSFCELVALYGDGKEVIEIKRIRELGKVMREVVRKGIADQVVEIGGKLSRYESLRATTQQGEILH